MSEDLLYEEIYQKTQDCGRTQFVRLLQQNQIRIKQLQQENELNKYILTEFEKWLVENYCLYIDEVSQNSQVKKIYDKLQELKKEGKK